MIGLGGREGKIVIGLEEGEGKIVIGLGGEEGKIVIGLRGGEGKIVIGLGCIYQSLFLMINYSQFNFMATNICHQNQLNGGKSEFMKNISYKGHI